MSERLLAVDLGDRRTGIAAGDTVSGTVVPLTVLAMDRNDALLDAVAAIVREHGPDAVILGLPLNMDGAEGPRAKLTRDFGEALAEATGIQVHMHDERLTSFEAEQRMRGTSRRAKKEHADAVAACVLLESWLTGR